MKRLAPVLAVIALFAVLPAQARASAPPIDVPSSELEADATPEPALRWEVDGSFLKSFSGEESSAYSSARLAVRRRMFTSTASAGLDLRYWPSRAYPLADDAGVGTWAAGVNGQAHLFQSRHFGGSVGASLLWVPGHSQFALAPEASLKWFVSQRLAVGVSYSVISDFGWSILSFDPPSTGRSRQSLGVGLSVYL